MVKQLVGRLLGYLAMEHCFLVSLWRRICRPGLEDWTRYLQRYGGLHAIGADCAISPDTFIADPHLVAIGNNVRIAGAFITAHDGSVNMVNRATGSHFDAVAAVQVFDDVFIGKGAIVLPGVKIGPRAIVGAGTVVARDVPPDSVVAGNPARVVATFQDHVAKLERRNALMPWRPLIEARTGSFDPRLEVELSRQRVRHFFGGPAFE